MVERRSRGGDNGTVGLAKRTRQNTSQSKAVSTKVKQTTVTAAVPANVPTGLDNDLSTAAETSPAGITPGVITPNIIPNGERGSIRRTSSSHEEMKNASKSLVEQLVDIEHKLFSIECSYLADGWTKYTKGSLMQGYNLNSGLINHGYGNGAPADVPNGTSINPSDYHSDGVQPQSNDEGPNATVTTLDSSNPTICGSQVNRRRNNAMLKTFLTGLAPSDETERIRWCDEHEDFLQRTIRDLLPNGATTAAIGGRPGTGPSGDLVQVRDCLFSLTSCSADLTQLLLTPPSERDDRLKTLSASAIAQSTQEK